MHDRRLGPRIATIGAAALVCFAAGAAIASYRVGGRASEPSIHPFGRIWLGPKGPALQDAIDEKLKLALAALNDPSRGAKDRVPAYRSELQAAQSLLRRAMLANLTGTRAIQQLAAVDWELNVLDGNADDPGATALIDIAAARAPRVPDIQVELGEILCRLGRVDDATRFMARAISLSPSIAHRAVSILVAAGVDPLEIQRALPAAPEVLIALAPEFSARQRGAEFLSLLETRARVGPANLIDTYGSLARSLGQAEHATAYLAGVGRLEDTHAEAERQFQLGLAATVVGDQQAAFRFGSVALSLWPADPRYCEFAGSSAIAIDRLADAEAVLRDGIARLANIEGTAGWRARLYRTLGEAFERGGNGDEALVLYRRALEHDPAEYVARKKVAQIESLVPMKEDHEP